MSLYNFVSYMRGLLEINDDSLILAGCLGYEYGKKEGQQEILEPQKDDVFFNIINNTKYRFDGERWMEILE